MSRDQHISIAEEELVERLQAKDEAALSILYDKYAASIYGVVSRIVVSEDLAEDVMQECFIKFWYSFNQYDSSKGRLFTWMLNIAKNAAIDKLRSKHQRVASRTGDIETNQIHGIHSSYDVKPDHIGIREIVQQLNPDHKKIIDMMYFDGYTQSEVADELAIPLGTVKTRTRAAMKLLTKLMSSV